VIDRDEELEEQREGFVWDDGGRAAAGYRGTTGDCVCRSIAIAAQLPYQEVYDALNRAALRERPRGRSKRSSARTGVAKPTIKRFLEELGWAWTPTMHIGSGCKVHLCAEELPAGRLIVQLSGHITAVIDGEVHDIYDPRRPGVSWPYGSAEEPVVRETRCVYGYWRREEEQA
jgi:hypothetical protein